MTSYIYADRSLARFLLKYVHYIYELPREINLLSLGFLKRAEDRHRQTRTLNKSHGKKALSPEIEKACVHACSTVQYILYQSQRSLSTRTW